MEPMKLKTAVKDYLWGGTRLREEYGVDAPLDKLAEAWMQIGRASCRERV